MSETAADAHENLQTAQRCERRAAGRVHGPRVPTNAASRAACLVFLGTKQACNTISLTKDTVVMQKLLRIAVQTQLTLSLAFSRFFGLLAAQAAANACAAPNLDLIEWFSGVESEVQAFEAGGYRALGCPAGTNQHVTLQLAILNVSEVCWTFAMISCSLLAAACQTDRQTDRLRPARRPAGTRSRRIRASWTSCRTRASFTRSL